MTEWSFAVLSSACVIKRLEKYIGQHTFNTVVLASTSRDREMISICSDTGVAKKKA